MIYVAWIALAFVVAFMGADRKIGFWGALILSLIFSPAVGIIVVLLSKTEKEMYQEELLYQQTQEAHILSMKPTAADFERLEKAKNLLGKEEYDRKLRLLQEADRRHPL